MIDYDDCPDCGGTGNASEYDTEYHQCRTCKGRGYIQEETN